MKVQEAAYQLLLKEGRPLPSRELAKLALDGGFVTSNSGDPILSIASTLEKNIREETYNQPALAFIKTHTGRQIALPIWRSADLPKLLPPRKFALQIPIDLMKKVRLAEQAGLASSLEETVAVLIKLGLASAAPRIKESLAKQLNELDQI